MEASQARTFRNAECTVLLACGGAVTLAAWLWLTGPGGYASQHYVRMAFMPAGWHHPVDFRAFASLVMMWQAMTIAMMTPASLQWLLAFAALAGGNGGERRRFRPVAMFGAGYFVVWLGYSILAAVLQTGIEHAGFLERNGRLPAQAGGAVLMAAGLLYFTPFQRACLRHCRNPLTYFLAHWKNGPRNGFAVGLTHGAYCVGCCWALMITGFAVGVMNILWMVFLTLLVCLQKLAPYGDRIGAVAAAAMVLWGFELLF